GSQDINRAAIHSGSRTWPIVISGASVRVAGVLHYRRPKLGAVGGVQRNADVPIHAVNVPANLGKGLSSADGKAGVTIGDGHEPKWIRNRTTPIFLNPVRGHPIVVWAAILGPISGWSCQSDKGK